MRAATITGDDTLVVVADDGADLSEALVAAVVRAGLDPVLVSVMPLEHLVDPVCGPDYPSLTDWLEKPPREPRRAVPSSIKAE